MCGDRLQHQYSQTGQCSFPHHARLHGGGDDEDPRARRLGLAPAHLRGSGRSRSGRPRPLPPGVDPSAFSVAFATISEWSPPSTTYSVEGARIRLRTSSRSSSGQRGSRVPCTNRIGRLELEQNLIAKLRPVAGAAKRIAEADHGLDRIDERDMAADAPAHAFAGEHDRPAMLGAKRGERRPMRFDELGQRVRPPSALQGIRIVERLDRADRPQEPRESPHPRMRGRSAGAGREQKGGSGIGHERQSIRSKSPSQSSRIWPAARFRKALYMAGARSSCQAYRLG